MIWRCFATKTSDVREDSRDSAIHCVLQEELWVFACGWYEISDVPFCSLFLSKPLLKFAHKQYQNSHYILTTALSRKNRALCYVAYVEKFDVGWQTIVEKSLTCTWMMVPTQGWTGVAEKCTFLQRRWFQTPGTTGCTLLSWWQHFTNMARRFNLDPHYRAHMVYYATVSSWLQVLK